MLLIDAAWLRERMGEELLPCPPLIMGAALSSKAGAVMDAILADQENAADMLIELLLELRARHSRADKGDETHPPQWPDLNDGDDATHADKTVTFHSYRFSRARPALFWHGSAPARIFFLVIGPCGGACGSASPSSKEQ